MWIEDGYSFKLYLPNTSTICYHIEYSANIDEDLDFFVYSNPDPNIVEEGEEFKLEECFEDVLNPTQEELTLLSLETGLDEKYLKAIPKIVKRLRDNG